MQQNCRYEISEENDYRKFLNDLCNELWDVQKNPNIFISIFFYITGEQRLHTILHFYLTTDRVNVDTCPLFCELNVFSLSNFSKMNNIQDVYRQHRWWLSFDRPVFVSISAWDSIHVMCLQLISILINKMCNFHHTTAHCTREWYSITHVYMYTYTMCIWYEGSL